MKKATGILLSLILLITWIIGPIPVNAASDPQTLGDLKNELAALKKKKSDNDANQKYTQAQIQAREEAIRNAEYEITKAQSDMEEAEAKIEESNNKIDSLKEEDNAWEFYNLGIGDPITISASQGLALGDMLDRVVSYFDPVSEEEQEDEYIRIAMVGKPNVGKSSLINKLLGEERVIVSNVPGTTRDAIDSYLENDLGKFILIDTAGIRRKSKVKEEIERYSVIRTLTSIERADVCILMIDATEGITEQDEKIIGFAHEKRKAIMVIVNKWDLVEKDDKTMNKFKNDLQNNLKFLGYAEYLFISALTGQRVHKVLEMAKKCYDNYSKRIPTGVLNDVISKAVLMKEPPVVALKRLKIFYATQVAVKPPKFVFFVNDIQARHFSYERYLENQIRDSFDFKGTGIEIEYRERKDK